MKIQSVRDFLGNYFFENFTSFIHIVIIVTFRHQSQELDIGLREIVSIQNEETCLELAKIVRDAISMEMKNRRNFSHRCLKKRKFYSSDGVEVSTKNFCDLTVKIGIGGEIKILVRDCFCNLLLNIEEPPNGKIEEINKLLLRSIGL